MDDSPATRGQCRSWECPPSGFEACSTPVSSSSRKRSKTMCGRIRISSIKHRPEIDDNGRLDEAGHHEFTMPPHPGGQIVRYEMLNIQT
ncbi:hypothetical protein J6590_013246 [Homalodisca vitripennis]|nr:hypothetical protein J6590_013246 [Homalodisca vitripennis]